MIRSSRRNWGMFGIRAHAEHGMNIKMPATLTAQNFAFSPKKPNPNNDQFRRRGKSPSCKFNALRTLNTPCETLCTFVYSPRSLMGALRIRSSPLA